MNSASGFAFNSGQLRCDMWVFVKNFKKAGRACMAVQRERVKAGARICR